jgi:hypothetical protein
MIYDYAPPSVHELQMTCLRDARTSLPDPGMYSKHKRDGPWRTQEASVSR